MTSLKLLLAIVGFVLLADLCKFWQLEKSLKSVTFFDLAGLGATIRDGMGRQMDFDPNAEPAMSDLDPVAPPSRGFLQRIFDMIKNFLGSNKFIELVISQIPNLVQLFSSISGWGQNDHNAQWRDCGRDSWWRKRRRRIHLPNWQTTDGLHQHHPQYADGRQWNPPTRWILQPRWLRWHLQWHRTRADEDGKRSIKQRR